MPATFATRRLAALLLAPGLLLTACAGGDDGGEETTATPGPLPTLPSAEATAGATPEPTQSETLTPEQQADEAAKQAVVLTLDALSKVHQDPANYDPLSQARAFATGGAMEELAVARDQMLTADLHIEGDFVVHSMEVTKADYTGDESNGAPTLEIAACIDASGVTFYQGGELYEDLADVPVELKVLGVSYYTHEEPAGWRVVYSRQATGESLTC